MNGPRTYGGCIEPTSSCPILHECHTDPNFNNQPTHVEPSRVEVLARMSIVELKQELVENTNWHGASLQGMEGKTIDTTYDDLLINAVLATKLAMKNLS